LVGLPLASHKVALMVPLAESEKPVATLSWLIALASDSDVGRGPSGVMDPPGFQRTARAEMPTSAFRPAM